MNKALVEKNKQKLLEEKQRLERLLSKIAKPESENPGEYEATFPNMGDDEDDNAQEVAGFAANLSEESSFEDRLHKVSAALARIEDGTYGLCEVGGEEIDEARLQAVPEATKCVKHS